MPVQTFNCHINMAVEVLEPFLKGDTGRNTRGLLRLIILCTIAAAAVASRLFSVIRKSTSPNRRECLERSGLQYPSREHLN